MHLSFSRTTQVISWSLIYGLAQHMKIRSGTGMVSRYSTFLHSASGTTMLVRLALVIQPAIVWGTVYVEPGL